MAPNNRLATRRTKQGIAPAIRLTGASSQHGVASAADSLARDDFDSIDPVNFLQERDVTLFGEIKLADILAEAVRVASALPDVWSIDVYHSGSTIEDPTAQIWSYRWYPIVKRQYGPFHSDITEEDQAESTANRVLMIKGEGGLPVNGRPNFCIELEMVRFALDFELLKLKFRRLAVELRSNEKPKVAIKFHSVEFSEHLAFVAALADLLSGPQFGGEGGTLTITNDSVGVHFGVRTGAMGFGSFSIASFPVTLDAVFPIPLTGGLINPTADGARLTICFASRSDPFRVTVSGYGGVGHFLIVSSLQRVVAIEGSLAFAYIAELEVGSIGRGEISFSAGIYYRRVSDTGPSSYLLEGFVTLTGHVRVFRLIDISVALSLHLRYESDTNSLVGEAILYVSIQVLFFRASGGYRIRRKFQGSERGLLGSTTPPMPFTARVSRQQWDQYVAAFS